MGDLSQIGRSGVAFAESKLAESVLSEGAIPSAHDSQKQRVDPVAVAAWALIAATLIITWSIALWSVGKLI